MPNLLRRWLPVLLVVAALSLVALAAAGSGLTGGPVPPPGGLDSPRQPVPQTPTATPTPPATPPAADEAPSESWVETLVNVVVVAYLVALSVALLSLLAYLAYRAAHQLFFQRPQLGGLRDQPASQPEGEDALREQVQAAVRASLADIDAGADPRRAVIACWLRLERLASSAGTAREAADTPAELVTRLLVRHRVSPEALDELADAYRQARYAPAEVDARLVEVARASLQTVDRQLSATGALR